MKKLIHICMSMLLVVATTGLTLHQHYCGDELMQSGLEQHNSCCSDSDADATGTNGDCCDNTVTTLGTDTGFQAGHFSAAIALLPAALPQLFLTYFESLLRLSSELTTLPHFAEAPPRYGMPYLASLCVLLI